MTSGSRRIAEDTEEGFSAEIRGAVARGVARGWCWPENESKVMDTELALAIAEEVNRLVLPKLEAAEQENERLRAYVEELEFAADLARGNV